MRYETPPRAWGRHVPAQLAGLCGRNTPTGVGKTQPTRASARGVKKHPHGRGEDRQTAAHAQGLPETPPRAWGRLAAPRTTTPTVRNTPTGVGKTVGLREPRVAVGKHPHGRGEDILSCLLTVAGWETPPRAWGRRRWVHADREGLGNTPTGVGKTPRPWAAEQAARKHPHGRGEDPVIQLNALPVGETPPRAWGRHYEQTRFASLHRNTPTGVGKTCAAPSCAPAHQKHPHGRGEDSAMPLPCCTMRETPPRAWGRPPCLGWLAHSLGNTPTGVGKTAHCRSWVLCCEKHPHGRGEDGASIGALQAEWETPPRAWGRRIPGYTLVQLIGNTPTGVGKTRPRRRHPPPNEKHPHGRGEDLCCVAVGES